MPQPIQNPWQRIWGLSPGGLWFSDDTSEVQIADLQLREREKFLYEYDLIDGWQHEICVEALSAPEQQLEYPVCLGGKRLAPPEGCGGPWGFQTTRPNLMMMWTMP